MSDGIEVNQPEQLGDDINQMVADNMTDMQAEEELEQMKAQLADMEKEAAKLQEVQEKAKQEAGIGAPGSISDVAKEEADARSVYVGSVDYGCTPEELQAHFQECGTVNRVTILTDRGGNPKGFAYVEFLEVDAVESACLMDGTELRGRTLKVNPKRTNVPGLKQRGRGRGRGRGGFFPMPMMAPMMFGYGYGMPPFGGPPGRGRGRGRGRGGGGGFGGYAPY